MNKSKFKDLIVNLKANTSNKFNDNKHYSHVFRVCQVQAIEIAIEADIEIARLRNIAQQVHDRLLRGDSDLELLALLDQANTSPALT